MYTKDKRNNEKKKQFPVAVNEYFSPEFRKRKGTNIVTGVITLGLIHLLLQINSVLTTKT